LRRAKVTGAVGSSTAVRPNILPEHGRQVVLAEDQRTVSELGSEGAYEPFGETVCPRVAKRIRHVDAGGEHSVE
jgi:hypothetical protein